MGWTSREGTLGETTLLEHLERDRWGGHPGGHLRMGGPLWRRALRHGSRWGGTQRHPGIGQRIAPVGVRPSFHSCSALPCLPVLLYGKVVSGLGSQHCREWLVRDLLVPRLSEFCSPCISLPNLPISIAIRVQCFMSVC